MMEIQNEMCEIELKQTELERQGVEIETKIRDMTENGEVVFNDILSQFNSSIYTYL